MIGIIDYDAGNIRSVVNALKRLGVPYIVSNDRAELSKVSKIILPGVGEARSAMDSLRAVRLDRWLKEQTVPFLGICLGMQVLFDHSTERDTPCLGLIDGTIRHFRRTTAAPKVPHMGWNDVTITGENPLFNGILSGEYFYFVHSYYAPLVHAAIGTTEYGIRFTSAAQKNNFYGVQFHPEKSGQAGLHLLKNFVELC
jgi:imidazole glycerol-phosphate synthase subunit HisH